MRIFKIFSLLLLLSIIYPTNGSISYETIGVSDKSIIPNSPNIIFLIGDGMGPEELKLASLIEYGAENLTIMDKEFQYKSNYSTDAIDGSITDSAAGGTALATGQKTINSRVSTDRYNTVKYKTILEYLGNDFGYSTGIVTTIEMAHATPAVFTSHIKYRDKKADIFNQQLKQNMTVMLSGGLGLPYIGEKEKIDELGNSLGYDTATNTAELLKLKGKSDKILGIFPTKTGIPYELEREIDISPSLIQMSDVALDVLYRQKNPFFLMIEGAKIDYAGHLNNLNTNKTLYNVIETIIFEKTVRLALEYAKADGNTKVIVCADHETGGLEIVDYSSLDSTLTLDNYTDDVNNQIRMKRVNQIEVIWKDNAHWPTKVPFYGYGFSKTDMEISVNTDVFWVLVNELGNFPVINSLLLDFEENNRAVVKFKDADSTTKNITLHVKYQDTGEWKNITENLAIYKIEGVHIFNLDLGSSRDFSAFVTLYDGNLTTTSLVEYNYGPNVQVTENSNSSGEKTSFYMDSTIICIFVSIPFLYKKKIKL